MVSECCSPDVCWYPKRIKWLCCMTCLLHTNLLTSSHWSRILLQVVCILYWILELKVAKVTDSSEILSGAVIGCELLRSSMNVR